MSSEEELVNNKKSNKSKSEKKHKKEKKEKRKHDEESEDNGQHVDHQSSQSQSSQTKKLKSIQNMEMDVSPVKTTKKTSTAKIAPTEKSQTVTLHFSTIPTNEQEPKAFPYLLSFPHCPPSQEVLENADEKASFRPYSGKERKKDKHIIAMETPKLHFGGKNFGSDQVQENARKVFIGIFDKEKKEVKFIESRGVFLMQQSIKNIQDDSITNLSSNSKSFGQMRRDLVERFGGKRLRKELTVVGSIKNENTVFGDSSTLVANDTDQNEEHQPADLPAANYTTSDVSKVYDYKEIIHSVLLNHIHTVVDSFFEFLESKVTPIEEFCKDHGLVVSLTKRFIESSNFAGMTDDRKKEAIACIVFASYLIDICKFQGTIEEFGAKYKISFAACKALLTQCKYKLVAKKPIKIMRDQQNVIYNLIVISTLIAFGYSIDTFYLAFDVKEDVNRIIEHCKRVGCTVSVKSVLKPSQSSSTIDPDLLHKDPLQAASILSKKSQGQKELHTIALLSAPLQKQQFVLQSRKKKDTNWIPVVK